MKQTLNISSRIDELESDTGLNYAWVSSIFCDLNESHVSVQKINCAVALSIQLTVLSNEDIVGVTLFSIRYGDEIRIPLKKRCVPIRDKWQVEIIFKSELELNPFSFRFRIDTEASFFFYDAYGTHKYSVSNTNNFKYFYNRSRPSWLDSAVIYHIFVDSFSKSNRSSNASLKWGSVAPNDINTFYGGDLWGIIDRLDYLVDLGVNVLCLTPIFKSNTNHRYDIENYFEVDESLGGERALKSLLKHCRSKGVRIIFDGVFNHTSKASLWFDYDGDDHPKGATQDINSIYFDHFIFANHPHEYESFWGDKSLPKLNYKSEFLKKTIYKSDSSIVKYWILPPYGINGWRLDACNMIGNGPSLNNNAEVLEGIYCEIKKINPECYIFGEVPFDPQHVSQFRTLDGITNYSGFYTPLVFWLDKNKNFLSADMDQAFRQFRALLGEQFANSCKNFLGNHDKERLINILNNDLDSYLTALTMLFLFPGVPSLYYGEEIGVLNECQNDSRASMRWNKWSDLNIRIHAYTKKLIRLYKNFSCIQKGSYRSLVSIEGTFAFERRYESEIVIALLPNIKLEGKVLWVKLDTIADIVTDSLCVESQNSKIVLFDGDDLIRICKIENNLPVIISAKLQS